MNRQTADLFDFGDTAYTDGVKVGPFIYLAGQVGYDPKTKKVVSDNFEEQAIQAWENIKALLEQFNTDCSAIVATTTYVRDAADWDKFVSVRQGFIPAGTTVAGTGVVSDLLEPELLLEVVATAYLEE